MAILENGYGKTSFSWDFAVVLNWAKRMTNCRTSSQHMPLSGLVQQAKKSHQEWDLKWHMCLHTTLLLPSTATCVSWDSKCHCHQQKTKDPILHKGNTGSATLYYGSLPKGLTAMQNGNCYGWVMAKRSPSLWKAWKTLLKQCPWKSEYYGVSQGRKYWLSTLEQPKVTQDYDNTITCLILSIQQSYKIWTWLIKKTYIKSHLNATVSLE